MIGCTHVAADRSSRVVTAATGARRPLVPKCGCMNALRVQAFWSKIRLMAYGKGAVRLAA